MWRPLNLIPLSVLVAGMACLVLGTIAVFTPAASNGERELALIGLVVTSTGIGMYLL